MAGLGKKWVRFVRQYGPIARNDNMYDERIQKSARRYGVDAINFAHPYEARLLAAISPDAPKAMSVVLTGTAGDGKSRLCGRVWKALGGDERTWGLDDIYHETRAQIAGRERVVGIIRDLTALPEQGSYGAFADKASLLHAVSSAFLDPDPDTIYVVAANDGQLMDTWRRLDNGGSAAETRALLEQCLIDGKQAENVAFFNLSTVPCTEILELALSALLSHPGWNEAYQDSEPDGFFGPDCPIRRNYEILSSAPFQSRLIALFKLMELNELHTPIRRVLLLLSNMLLGHPAATDRLMQPADIRGYIHDRTAFKGDIYQNVFGANLTPARRDGLEIIEFLNRFGIGEETTNRVDNILVFGPNDENLRVYYRELVENGLSKDSLERLRSLRNQYLEHPETAQDNDHEFLASLAAQRRKMFFTIPDQQADELRLWDLTVFRHAGEFLSDVVEPLQRGERVARANVALIVKGLNRVFTGMLVSTDRELLIASGLSGSTTAVSQILQERVSVAPRKGEKIEIIWDGLPTLVVHLDDHTRSRLPLNLVRYEFLTRVAEGALPGSFSRECHEDILAFKSALLAALARARPQEETGDLVFRLLTLNAEGEPADEAIEVRYA
ncbi:hypothetical protein GFL60_25475 [Rhizobium leguminosarum bv. viciae]|nr:hypothetical protein [Rhizobium leguminosarum bv. viciae]